MGTTECFANSLNFVPWYCWTVESARYNLDLAALRCMAFVPPGWASQPSRTASLKVGGLLLIRMKFQLHVMRLKHKFLGAVVRCSMSTFAFSGVQLRFIDHAYL